MQMLLQDLDYHSDQLISTAFTGNYETGERVAKLQAMAESIGTLVTQSWEYSTEYLRQGLRASSFLACMPSLETVARSQPHSLAVASEVSNNFQLLSKQILATPGMKRKQVFRNSGETGLAHAIGQWSEI